MSFLAEPSDFRPESSSRIESIAGVGRFSVVLRVSSAGVEEVVHHHELLRQGSPGGQGIAHVLPDVVVLVQDIHRLVDADQTGFVADLTSGRDRTVLTRGQGEVGIGLEGVANAVGIAAHELVGHDQIVEFLGLHRLETNVGHQGTGVAQTRLFLGLQPFHTHLEHFDLRIESELVRADQVENLLVGQPFETLVQRHLGEIAQDELVDLLQDGNGEEIGQTENIDAVLHGGLFDQEILAQLDGVVHLQMSDSTKNFR